jgi:hypothetical protein
MPKFINELNYDKKPYDSFDKNPAKIGYVNDIADVVTTGGSFYNSNTITTAAINTAYAVPTPTTVYAEGMSYASNTIVLNEPGTYSFDFTIQVFKNNTTTEGSLTAWLQVNGVAQDYTANTLSLAISSQVGIMTLHSHVVTTAPNIRVGLIYAANSTDMQLRTSAASAPYPAIASVTLEVDRIR